MMTLERMARSMISVLSWYRSKSVRNPGEMRMMLRCPGMAEMRRTASLSERRAARVVGGDALDADHAIGLHFDDAVHQEEWVAVGQNGPNLVNVQNWHGSLYRSEEHTSEL